MSPLTCSNPYPGLRAKLFTYDAASTAETLREVLHEDCYGLKRLRRAPTTILDIGANVGVFALHARELFPRAGICCVEPHPSSYECLVKNTAELNIAALNIALGRGRQLRCCAALHGSSYSQFNAQGEPGGALVASAPLGAICAAFGIGCSTQSTLIKIDCEGGETALFNDGEALAIINGAQALMLELHVPPWPQFTQFLPEQFWRQFYDQLVHASKEWTGTAPNYLIRAEQ